MTNAELQEKLKKFPPDLIVCGTGEWAFEINAVEKYIFDDTSWIEYTLELQGKECLFLTE